MQLEGATALELKVVQACYDIETYPASEKQTSIVYALSEAGEAIQDMRKRGQILFDACMAFHRWVDDNDWLLHQSSTFLKLYNDIVDAIIKGCHPNCRIDEPQPITEGS
jgi:hypothetical protein